MTTITFKEKLTFSKTDYDTLFEFLEEIEDYAFGKIISKTNSGKTFDIDLLEKKYLGK